MKLLLLTLIQDGDMVTLDSRWSCKPELDSTGSTACSITYNLLDPLYIQELNIGKTTYTVFPVLSSPAYK